MACGVAHSRCHHRSCTDANIGSGDVPLSDSVEGEEGSYNELSIVVAQFCEEVVVGEPGFVAESKPASPNSVSVLVSFFLFRVQDDSVVRSTSVTKEETDLGRGQMSKPFGMS
jgi:hypothetical protein